MEYLIIIYEKNKKYDGNRPQVSQMLRVTEKEMFAFVQEHSGEKEREVLFTVNKIECVLDFSYEI